MQYVSTRGEAPQLGFCDAVMAGLAEDGGLYLPKTWPQLSATEIANLANRPYAEVAFEIISRFVDGEIADADLRAILDEAYATFRHPSVAPILELEPGHYLLELFHGPTLAFKDVAMQFLARVMDQILSQRDQRATIVGATSGDTGSAAIHAFRNRDRVDVFILFPDGRVTPVQRRQMTTVLDANVHNIALQGTFDDCQTSVKAMFKNTRFRNTVSLSGVNSINWGRIVAQIVYYFTAAVTLGAPHRPVSFTVPTGNFGDIFAGYAAKKMGLPIDRLIVATNENDILRRALDTNQYETDQVIQTSSPSMDIQISSNFERLLFEASDRDAPLVQRMMNNLVQSGSFEIPNGTHDAIANDFDAFSSSQSQVAECIQRHLSEGEYLLDPHSAVAVHVAHQAKTKQFPMISLATAHPAKFPAAVKNACGVEPQLPQWLSDLHELPEKFDVLANDQSLIEEYIIARTRA